MFKKIFIAYLLLAYFSLSATPLFAYGENCSKVEGKQVCFGMNPAGPKGLGPGKDCSASKDSSGNWVSPICRCRATGSAGVTEAYCDSQALSFDDCSLWEDRTWVGTFRACLNLSEALNTSVQWAIALAAVAALGRLLIGAIQYIISSGDPKNIENARETLTNAILGLILVVSAWLIARTLSQGFEEYGLPIKFTELIFGP